MKKFISLLLFFFGFSLLNIQPVLAVCAPIDGQVLTTCRSGDYFCPKQGLDYCCDSQTACTGIGGGTVTLVPQNPTPQTPASCATPQLINTAIGPIDVCDINALTASILRLGIGIGGGIAFILMLAAVFMIMTSAGDPKRMQAGQELITSALMGLLLIIFSVFLLQLIGVTILEIPGFK